MNILFMAHRVPFPPDKGERIRAFHEIEFLSQTHTIDLFCPATSHKEVAYSSQLKKWCRNVVVEKVPLTGVARRAMSALVRNEPISPARFYSARLKEQVHAALSAKRYDLVLVNCSAMAQYLPDPAPCPVIVDFVDADSAKWRQYAPRKRFPLSWIYSREARCLAGLEKSLIDQCSASIAISQKEAGQLPGGAARVRVIGNGAKAPDPNAAVPVEIDNLKPYVIFVGTMNYLPNVDAATHFALDILPRVRRVNPSTQFVIVGRNPSNEVQALSRLQGVHVTGEVPDVGVYLRGAHVAVAPFRISQGVHNKILEAMTAGVPVVCTALPVEGLAPELQRRVTVAAGIQDFADKVAQLLANDDARVNCRENAREFCEGLCWDRVLRPLEELVQMVGAKQFGSWSEDKVIEDRNCEQVGNPL